jgi:hypothetical protein
MAHASNPGYSGPDMQENHGLKPAWAMVLKALSQKYPIQKRSGVAQVVECLP